MRSGAGSNARPFRGPMARPFFARATAAIGPDASATFSNSAAIGAVAAAPNQMALGTASSTYRMSGIASTASLAAQTGPTSFVRGYGNGGGNRHMSASAASFDDGFVTGIPSMRPAPTASVNPDPRLQILTDRLGRRCKARLRAFCAMLLRNITSQQSGRNGLFHFRHRTNG
jgi:hypothetical protein